MISKVLNIICIQLKGKFSLLFGYLKFIKLFFSHLKNLLLISLSKLSTHYKLKLLEGNMLHSSHNMIPQDKVKLSDLKLIPNWLITTLTSNLDWSILKPNNLKTLLPNISLMKVQEKLNKHKSPKPPKPMLKNLSSHIKKLNLKEDYFLDGIGLTSSFLLWH